MNMVKESVQISLRTYCPSEGTGYAHEAETLPIGLLFSFGLPARVHTYSYTVVYGGYRAYSPLGSRPHGRKI